MHTQQRNWVKALKERLPEYFYFRDILEIGSVNINGSIREYFEGCEYIGLDVAPGPGVDVVCVAHEYLPGKQFDVVCSTSALEHDMYWQKTLRKMVELTRSGGLMFFSCGSRWEEHGTLTHKPTDSLTTGKDGVWASYYQNLEPDDITHLLDLNELFTDWQLGLDSQMDLYFWGIKK